MMIITAAAMLISANVMYIQNGEVKVGEVMKQSGNVTYVRPCDNPSQIYRVPVQRHEIIGPVPRLSCREYRDNRREIGD